MIRKVSPYMGLSFLPGGVKETCRYMKTIPTTPGETSMYDYSAVTMELFIRWTLINIAWGVPFMLIGFYTGMKFLDRRDRKKAANK